MIILYNIFYAGSKIIHATVLVSRMLPCDVMVKEVPAVLAVTFTEVPSVPAVVCLVRNILEFAVTAVVFTTTTPATSVAMPILAFVPSFTSNPAPVVRILTDPTESTLILDVLDAPISTEFAVELFTFEPKADEAVAEAVVPYPTADDVNPEAVL